ncbi:hypothetical protein FACS1894166_01490 [Bacilli bacterium]|nr:hypothetical protein FACS1894166_01490 [Bacilli bacterium]
MIKTLLSNIEFYEKLKDDFTYHSSAIEGSTLTYEDNKTAIDHPDTVKPEQFPNKYKHDELQENINCGVLFDYVISTINERLNERELKIWHNILKKNTK